MRLINFFIRGFNKDRGKKKIKGKAGLNYDKMIGAAGHIYCREWSFIALIDVCRFEEGFSVRKTSYQCLGCGKFNNVSLRKNEVIPCCSCGGRLSKTHQLFCPQCKGKDLQYMCYYFT